jgi:uncharacterized protein
MTTPHAPTRSGLPPWASLGIIFGLVGAASILLFGPIGVSGTYPRLIGEVARAVDPAYAASNPYLVRMGSILRPETFLVIGLVIGGFLGAKPASRCREGAEDRDCRTWVRPAMGKRYTEAFLAGFLILLFGARLAGGCTSGLIISGITQLSIAGLRVRGGRLCDGYRDGQGLSGAPRREGSEWQTSLRRSSPASRWDCSSSASARRVPR